MENIKVKPIPYGLSNYSRLRERNCYYVDKTMFLPAIEEAGDYLFLIRPRRFGKSLLLSVMESYYDVYFKDRFEELFKETWIYDHSTPERGKYLVLGFNFSVVDPNPEMVESSFLNHVRSIAVDFIRKYDNRLSTNTKKDYYTRSIEESGSAPDILHNLLILCSGARQKLYVLIDEYDNFSNTILTTAGKDSYRELTHGPGFFRAFFNVLKSGTSKTDAPVTRSLITGVSPITMDDVTSGYNIGENVSLDKGFNQLLGFTRPEVEQMIEYYREAELIYHDTVEVLDIMTHWYGNYRFSGDDDTCVFNSDMVLYFIKNYIKRGKLPDDLIDRNVRIDYGKLRHLVIIDRAKTGETGKEGKPPIPNGNFSKLKQIIEDGGTTARIEKGFPMEKIADPVHFKSLLFYLGLLSIKGPEKDMVRLEIPNETVQRLYYDYFIEVYRETGIFSLDLSAYSELMSGMAYDGKWRPLFDFITGRMQESMSLRDLITGEKSIQAFLNVYLGLSDLYVVHTERESKKGYVDILMEPFQARYEGIKYSFLLEIKYLKAAKKPDEKKFEELKKAAEKQLLSYTLDKKLARILGKTTLVKLVLIFCGPDLIHIDSPRK